MSKKYLDYLDLKKAFLIFRKGQKQKDLLNKDIYNSEILKLKNRMNDKRINFKMPKNQIKITANYLLGYIEGDGSFYFNKTNNTVLISLITITKDRIFFRKNKRIFVKSIR